MKDEYSGKSILKFVGLKSKMYSIKVIAKGAQVKVTMLLLSFKSLSCFDDKGYILKNGINTLAYGHKDI